MAGRARLGGRELQLRRVLLPLALAQFICSFAGSNMNVMINDISKDLDTTVQGVQVAITIFLLVMAALMIPGGKLTDKYGRKRCFTVGLVVYGVGALMSAVSPGLGVLILGNSILEGVGTALLIPPVYILTTLLFTEITSRARAFGVDQRDGRDRRRGGAVDRRSDHLRDQLASGFRLPGARHRGDHLAEPRGADPLPADPTRPFDTGGAVLSAVGLVLVVTGHPGGRQEPLARCSALIVAGVARADLVLPVDAGRRSARAESRCCRPACSATGRPTSAWSRRTPSGCC